MIAWRVLWKDWGFAPALFGQATHFLALARDSAPGNSQEGLIRASVVFFLMSFEAFFYALIKGFIQENRVKLNTERPGAVDQVALDMKNKAGVFDAVKKWPKLLTGKPLDSATKPYQNFVKLTKYRNNLVHGKIAEEIPGWGGLLAQDVEAVETAELARRTVSAMLEMITSRFGVPPPDWT